MDLEGEPLVMFCGVVSSICNAAAVDVENSGTGENALTNDEGSTITTVPAARGADGSPGTSNCGPAINFSIIACFTLQISTGDSPAPRLARSAVRLAMSCAAVSISRCRRPAAATGVTL